MDFQESVDCKVNKKHKACGNTNATHGHNGNCFT